MDQFIIIMLNLCHPSGILIPFVLSDELENTIIFPSKETAQSWIDINKSGLFAYSILDINDLEFQF